MYVCVYIYIYIYICMYTYRVIMTEYTLSKIVFTTVFFNSFALT